ncbi:hypothetical protein YC2023_052129 [Brassica napus]
MNIKFGVLMFKEIGERLESFRRLIGREDAQSVKMSVKHFSESLQCNLTEPDSASYGIASLGVSLTVIFPFMVLGTRQSDK